MKASTHEVLRTIVLVEPICRGSRLQILANTLSALKGRANVILVTRRDYQSEHFTELVVSVGLTPRVVTVDTDLSGAWMKNLSLDEFQRFYRALCTLEIELAPKGAYDLVFMALDDYLLAFSVFAIMLRVTLRNANVFGIKYRVEYLFSLSKGAKLRGMALRLMTRWSLFAAKARLICFDERLLVVRPRYLKGILPDPWFGPFSPGLREQGRSLLGVNSSDFVLLTLGKQDRRKGIDFLIDVFPQIALDRRVKLAVVGTISPLFAEAFRRLKRCFPTQIVHVDAFVLEAELPTYFSAPDAFLLPYSEDFTATSGTLARATASGVAVLATAHGLVGYRVREFGLGGTFDAYSQSSFLEALNSLVQRTAEERNVAQRQSLHFAETCSLPRFENAVRTALSI